MSQATQATTTIPAPAGIEITHKGERYLADHPLPKRARSALKRLRREAEAEIERLLALVDRIDGEADLEGAAEREEDEDGPDGEPSLGWTEDQAIFGRAPSNPATEDGEVDDSDTEDTADEEPSLGAPETFLGRMMVEDPSWSTTQQEQRCDPGFDQSGWGSRPGDDRESEFDGREDCGDHEDADNGIADSDALYDPAVVGAAGFGFSGSGNRWAQDALQRAGKAAAV